MEFTVSSLSSQSFTIASFLTFLCCIISLFAVRFYTRSPKSLRSDGHSTDTSRLAGSGDGMDTDMSDSYEKKNSRNCSCSCNSIVFKSSSDAKANGISEERPLVLSERQTGASMMEQLVPEIRTHALSYLDYPSLCRLSMTNSLMRKAANDDSAWKALYRKDFTREQSSVRPANGWKAYYAATRAIMNVNAEFVNIIRDRSLPAMGRFWLNTDYVKCIHPSGELFSGYNAVMESWQIAFSFELQGGGFQVRDVQARVLTDMAWVTMKAYFDLEPGYNLTNTFEFHDGRWYMVHHHCSFMDEVNQQAVHP